MSTFLFPPNTSFLKLLWYTELNAYRIMLPFLNSFSLHANRAFDNVLKSWAKRQRLRPLSRLSLFVQPLKIVPNINFDFQGG